MAIGTPVSRGTTSGATGTTLTVTTTANIASGSKVFVLVTYRTNSSIAISSVSDNGPGLTYTIDKNVAQTTQSCGHISADAPSGMASGTVITVTFAASVTRSFGDVVEVTGLASQPANDKDSENQNSSTTATTFTSNATATTTQNDELALYIVSMRNQVEASITWTSGTQISRLTSTDTHGTAYEILSATGTPSSAGSYPTGARNDAAVVTYKAAAGGTNWTDTENDSVTMSDALVFDRQIVVADSVTMSDSVSLGENLVIADSVTMSDGVAAERGISTTINDSVTMSDGAATATGKGDTENDSVTMTDTIAFQRSWTINDTVTMSDGIATQADYRRVFGSPQNDVAMSDFIDPVKTSGGGTLPPVTVRTYLVGANGATRATSPLTATDATGASGILRLTGTSGATDATGTSGRTETT